MCRAVTCKTCGKTTWAGCGEHVDAVRRAVPAAQWCSGHTGGNGAASTVEADRPTQGGLFARLFGKA